MSVSNAPIDWSFNAAWIALFISIAGTIIGPIITAIINNMHESKLYKLRMKNKRLDQINQAKISALDSFISSIGKVMSCDTPENRSELGKSYFAAYPYFSPDKYPWLNSFYCRLIDGNDVYGYDEVIKYAAEILKEVPQ